MRTAVVMRYGNAQVEHMIYKKTTGAAYGRLPRLSYVLAVFFGEVDAQAALELG